MSRETEPLLMLSRNPFADDTGRQRAESFRLGGGGHSPLTQPAGSRIEERHSSSDDDGDDEDAAHRGRGNAADRSPGLAIGYQTVTSAPLPRVRKSISTTKTAPSQQRPPAEGPPANGSSGAGAGSAAGRAGPNQWWKDFFLQFQSLELENKGSVARDHLALERTFLAWLRTSLSFASIGIAITQLFRLNTSLTEQTGAPDTLRQLGKPLGATFLAISIVMLFLGYHRYVQSQQWVIRGKFPASRGTVMFVSFVAFAVMVASLVVVVAVHPGADD